MRDEQFGFRPWHSMSLQLARLFERIIRDFGEKRLTGAVFLDAVKAFDTVWIEGFLHKLTLLNFSSYIVYDIIPPEPDVRSVLPDGHVISWHEVWGGSGWIDPSYPQSVCQRHDLTIAPRRVSSLRGRHGHHSNVPQADAARQLPGVIPQRHSTVVE